MPNSQSNNEPIPMKALESASEIFKVLSHPHRLKMVELLIQGSISVGDLAEQVNLPPAAVSQHLNNMRAHRIVAAKREGRLVYYEVIHPNAVFLIDCIRRNMGTL